MTGFSPRNALVLQCGGPTAVMNASLAGIITAWQARAGTRLFGGRWGFRGLAAGDWIELTHFSEADRLRLQAGAALGSARDVFSDAAAARFLPQVATAGIGVLFVIGGNGTFTAAHRLREFARSAGFELRVIGVPKTIDNDIPETDVTPGYGSAARFVARVVHDAALDLHSMRGFDDVGVIEVMGRHTGWLAAAASLAHWNTAPVRPLILVPERPVVDDDLIAAVRERHESDGVCLVVAAEGVRDRSGAFLAEKTMRAERDDTGQQLLSLAGGPAPYLAQLVRARLNLRCRQSRPDTIQRSNGALASTLDRELASRAGSDAVALALEGADEVMVALRRDGTNWRTEPVELQRIVGGERTLPQRYIGERLDITKAFADDFRCFLDGWQPGAVLFTGPAA